MITSLFLHPLGPSLVLALAGLLLLPLRRPGRPRASAFAGWAPPAAFVFLGAATVVLIVLRLGHAGSSVLQWNWQPLTVAGSTLTWRLDGWNWLAALLILLVAAVALAAQGSPSADPHGPERAQRTLWLAGAALAFVFSDNLVTLACSWICLDVALTLRLLPGQTEEPSGRVWLLAGLAGMAVLAALILAGEGNVRSALIGGSFSRPVLGLLWLAALVRAGAYPLHSWLIGQGQLETGDLVALHLIGPVAGIWLLGRLEALAGPIWLHRPEWAALGALALLGTALAAWVASGHNATWRWVAINRASLVVLTAYVTGTAGPPALMWPLITFALGAGLLALGLAVRVRWGWRLPLWLGALAAWGLPGTPGFLARWVLVWPTDLAKGAVPGTPTDLPFGPLLFLLILVSEVLLVAALWELVTADAEGASQDEPAQADGQALAGAAVPALASRANPVTGMLLGFLRPAPEGPDLRQKPSPASPEAPAWFRAIAKPVSAGADASAATPVTAPVAVACPDAPPVAADQTAAMAPVARPDGNGVTTAHNGSFGKAPRRVRPAVKGPLALATVIVLAVATIMLVVPLLVWGLAPGQPLALAGLLNSGLPLSLGQALAEARRSVWAGLVVAGALGALLGWARPLIFTGMRGWQEGIMAVVSLEWLYQGAIMLLSLAGTGLQYFARLGEGQGYLGWLAVAGAILWILLRS